MTKEFFEKYYLGSLVNVEWDKSLKGKITGITSDNYIEVLIGEKLMAFPLDQLEFAS